MSDPESSAEAARNSEKTPQPLCGNCGKAAYIMLGGYPACIDCKYKVDLGQWMAFAQNAAMINFASQEIDDAVGFGGRSPMIQIPKPPVPPISYNHQTVSVSGGAVGAINFGTIRDIQLNLQNLAAQGSESIAEPLSKLTDAVINAQDADEEAKNDLLEQIASLVALANAAPEERKKGTAKALFGAIKEGSGAIGSVAGAWTTVEPLLRGFLGF